jgi:hypothetical protein
MAAAFLFCIAGQERESDTPALPPHSLQPGQQRQSLQQRQKKRCLRQQLPQEGLQQQQQRNLCNSNALQMGLK